MKVLIVGGGLGGLCLANGLHKEGVEVRVFERHPSAESDKQGYFIHLEGQGREALQRCLNEQGWERFLATSTSAGSTWAFRDPQLQLIAMRDDVKITGKPAEVVERRAIIRWEFRSVLLKALGSEESEIVQWDKTFTHYEEIEGGRVLACFADGTTEEGDILVGADGSKSKVREQRLPYLHREDLGIVIICGQCSMNETSSCDLPLFMKDCSLNNIIPYGKGWLFVTSWCTQGSLKNEHADSHDDYTLWAYFVPKDDTPPNMTKLSAAELRDIVLGGVRGWASSINDIVQKANLSTIVPVYLRCAPHLEHWDSSNITLIGDAIHNMTPAAGVGANTALRDAQILTDLLVESARGKTSVAEAIGKYEAKMRPYANAAVALSRQIAESATSSSLFQRFMFRTVLRLAQASPFVMRATIGRGAVESYMK
ncbi:FAD/NAD(P)-binding domain-containing protein [Rhizodiscina lignyota]|uniref:FAD/NAD(P)-binding domain-containing protein n=1 Tax=Rhizodiscina lignyota TaxID=1504668 RepID=A0A9P4ICC5_9PEZI|nr:FAD/NAD(P)-binding domain-containing protein [Rhizodiscina lignyota]